MFFYKGNGRNVHVQTKGVYVWYVIYFTFIIYHEIVVYATIHNHSSQYCHISQQGKMNAPTTEPF